MFFYDFISLSNRLIILKLYSIRGQCCFFKDKGEESNSVLVLMIRKYGYIIIGIKKADSKGNKYF